MTVTLTPRLETQLRRKAERTGLDPNAMAETLLSDALADEATEEGLRDEYRHLAALGLRGALAEPQTARFRQVIEELDALDAQTPAAQAMTQRLDETGRKLDEMLAILRSLPVTEHVG